MKRLLLWAGVAGAAWWLGKRSGEARREPVILDAQGRVYADDVDRLWPLRQPNGDDGVLGALAMLDEHQIATAQMALNRPVPDAIQTLAATLRDEHRDSLARTRELIDRLGLELAQDPAVAEIEGHCFARRTELAGASDEDFEHAYLQDVVDDHERMLEFVDTSLAPAARDERVVEHVRHAREHLASHLAEARMLS